MTQTHRLPLRFLAALLGSFLIFSSATAQTSTTATETQSSAEQAAQTADQVTADVRDEIAELLDEAGNSFKDLETKEIYGIGAGIIVAAVAADLLGGNGLVTLGAMVAGGITGNWAANKWF